MRLLQLVTIVLALPLASTIALCDSHSMSLEDVVKMLKKQQAQIEVLQAELAEAKARTADEGGVATINTPQSPDAVGAQRSRWAPIGGKTLGKAAAWAERTSIGGYGELHANRLNGENGASDLDQTDFHRLVLFVGHEFNDWVRFASEIEMEHSHIGGGPGDVVLELAWLEMDITSNHHFRAGADILPVGILNLTHEPTTFYGVERNPVESEIIPSTWTEAGAGFWGSIAPGINYNLFFHTGLVMEDGITDRSAMRVRDGRIKVANAQNQDLAILGRLVYNGIPGLEVALTVDYQSDYTGTADNVDASAWFTEAHVDYKHRSGLGLRAIYTRWDFGSDGVFDPGVINADDVQGWYVEPSYKFALTGVPGEAGLFMRYANWDNRADAAGGNFAKRKMVGIGANYWPTPNVVFKIDGQWEDADGAMGTRDGVNLGLGFQF